RSPTAANPSGANRPRSSSSPTAKSKFPTSSPRLPIYLTRRIRVPWLATMQVAPKPTGHGAMVNAKGPSILEVFDGHDGAQRQEHEQANCVNLRLHLGVGFTSRHGLVGQEDQTPAVERRNWQEVEAAQVRAQARQEVQDVEATGFDHQSAILDDLDGAGDLGFRLARD